MVLSWESLGIGITAGLALLGAMATIVNYIMDAKMAPFKVMLDEMLKNSDKHQEEANVRNASIRLHDSQIQDIRSRLHKCLEDGCVI